MAGATRRGQGGARAFEDPWIWQQARALVPDVYRDFGDVSPAGRDFGFRSQIQRSAISIMNNIAEGFERNDRILLISLGSSTSRKDPPARSAACITRLKT